MFTFYANTLRRREGQREKGLLTMGGSFNVALWKICNSAVSLSLKVLPKLSHSPWLYSPFACMSSLNSLWCEMVHANQLNPLVILKQYLEFTSTKLWIDSHVIDSHLILTIVLSLMFSDQKSLQEVESLESGVNKELQDLMKKQTNFQWLQVEIES